MFDCSVSDARSHFVFDCTLVMCDFFVLCFLVMCASPVVLFSVEMPTLFVFKLVSCALFSFSL